MALVYVWKVIEVAYFDEFPGDDDHPLREAPLGLLVPTWALVAASFYFGIDASFTSGAAGAAARTLLGVGP
jgi:multicomponent Na+:H+ antiporter subunit D